MSSGVLELASSPSPSRRGHYLVDQDRHNSTAAVRVALGVSRSGTETYVGCRKPVKERVHGLQPCIFSGTCMLSVDTSLVTSDCVKYGHWRAEVNLFDTADESVCAASSHSSSAIFVAIVPDPVVH